MTHRIIYALTPLTDLVIAAAAVSGIDRFVMPADTPDRAACLQAATGAGLAVLVEVDGAVTDPVRVVKQLEASLRFKAVGALAPRLNDSRARQLLALSTSVDAEKLPEILFWAGVPAEDHPGPLVPAYALRAQAVRTLGTRSTNTDVWLVNPSTDELKRRRVAALLREDRRPVLITHHVWSLVVGTASWIRSLDSGSELVLSPEVEEKPHANY